MAVDSEEQPDDFRSLDLYIAMLAMRKARLVSNRITRLMYLAASTCVPSHLSSRQYVRMINATITLRSSYLSRQNARSAMSLVLLSSEQRSLSPQRPAYCLDVSQLSREIQVHG
jgi:hypothetical protein